MKNKKEREILSIEILYDDKEELDELISSEDFNRLMFEEAIATIKMLSANNVNSPNVLYPQSRLLSIT